MNNFWKDLPKPLFILAPMYDVTDAAFRRMFARYGKPDVLVTEFVSADGLVSAGYEKLKHHLIFSKVERPIVAQIFGANPTNFTKAAKLLSDLGFDGIDINMGCPEKNVVKQGACSALFKNPKLAQKVVMATKTGAPNLPVSIKIRIGDIKVDWHDWIKALLEAKPDAITIHLRTRKEKSLVPAHWEDMPKIMDFVKANSPEGFRPLIIGNGDIKSLEDAFHKIKTSGCDGVMIGRGAFGNPFFFNRTTPWDSLPLEQRFNIIVEHVKLFEELLPGKNFEVMKKHFKAYIEGFPGASELRNELYKALNASDVEPILENWLSNHPKV